MSETTFFEQSVKAKDFDDWLSNISQEDIDWITRVNEDLSNDELRFADKSVFDDIMAILIYFSGKKELSQEELEDYWQAFTINLSLENNVRLGYMTKEGKYSMTDGSAARFKLTDSGTNYVKNMIGRQPNE